VCCHGRYVVVDRPGGVTDTGVVKENYGTLGREEMHEEGVPVVDRATEVVEEEERDTGGGPRRR
jgi:hypothetical protein